ncbi:MAG: putative ABC transport system ATP-binding protein [Porticoccaceae bacterium]|jgi:putative ABC transport system ATP-binding protein
MLEIDDLEFRYQVDGFGLRVASLRIAAGETVALVGPSGCGKTTLLNLLAAIAVPSKGNIRIDGRELTFMNDAARRAFRISSVGMVFQEFELLDYLNVEENILLPFLLNSSQRIRHESRADVAELAESLGLTSLLQRRIDRLSHGERQRVAIARALITNPQLLLADEPTGNLDPATRDRIVDLLFEHATRRQAAFVMATHDHSLTDRFDLVIDFSQPEQSGIELLRPETEHTPIAPECAS